MNCLPANSPSIIVRGRHRSSPGCASSGGMGRLETHLGEAFLLFVCLFSYWPFSRRAEKERLSHLCHHFRVADLRVNKRNPFSHDVNEVGCAAATWVGNGMSCGRLQGGRKFELLAGTRQSRSLMMLVLVGDVMDLQPEREKSWPARRTPSHLASQGAIGGSRM